MKGELYSILEKLGKKLSTMEEIRGLIIQYPDSKNLVSTMELLSGEVKTLVADIRGCSNVKC